MRRCVSSLLKLLRRISIDNVEVLSENPHYAPEVYSGDQLLEFAIIGRVRWVAAAL
ncbi:hypothetical protein [Brevundimonas aveniformis]|uniref:hypothetical protein n=1 Tax=Brevundimonas aveniformis TaxID=370977 RepID=UPI0024920A79|nr:hypothetical protein [Brevundimonas aveniformis]